MILCSCNILTKANIEAAARAMVAADPTRPVTPGRIFLALGARPNCGSCVDMIRRMLRDMGLPLTCPDPIASIAAPQLELVIETEEWVFDLPAKRA